MIGIQQEIRLLIPAHHIVDVYLSVPNWSKGKIDGTYGLLRDYPRARELHHRIKNETLGCGFDNISISLDEDKKQLAEPVYAYDTSDRHLYPEHLKNFNSGQQSNAFLTIGNGNLISNLGIIGGVINNGKLELLKSAWEDKRIMQGWKYSCLYYDRNNTRMGINRFTFSNSYPESIGGFSWLTSGQPILWDGIVSESEDLIAETYDIRHIYILRATSGSEEEKKKAISKIQKFMIAWMEIFVNEPQKSASKRLKAFARTPEFMFDKLRDHYCGRHLSIDREECPFIEKRYLQSAVGVDENGNVYIVQKHGSLKELGLTLKGMGAKRAILLDQGGSVGIFYMPKVESKNSDLNGKFIFRSRDFRPTRLCVLIWELNTDIWSEA